MDQNQVYLHNSLAEEFWSISLQLYALENVEHACLYLQDEYGCNVNLLLFCCWTAWRSNENLGVDTFKRLIQAVSHFHGDVILPLLNTRRRLGHQFEQIDTKPIATLKCQIASLELQAERVEQSIIISQYNVRQETVDALPKPKTETAYQNMMTYCIDVLRLSLTVEHVDVRTIATGVHSLP